MLYTIIAKPTKACNADCSYCSSPPDDADAWTVDTFRLIWSRLKSRVSPGANIIWHGGEPMLMGPDFYREAYRHVRAAGVPVNFSLQSNLLLYKSRRWKDVFEHVFRGAVSTSFDPDERHRTIQGSTDTYTRTFFTKINEVIQDGFRPLVIGTYSEQTAHLAHTMYERALGMGERAYHLRFNYQYPAGRAAEDGALITPETYGAMLLSLYERWMKDVPDFLITPLDQMFLRVAGREGERCPWTKNCGGRFLEIEPNGDLFNCGDMADLGDEAYRFGNVIEGTVNASRNALLDPDEFDGVVRLVGPDDLRHRPAADEVFGEAMLNTPAAARMRQRRYDLPIDCTTCRHFEECQGGCMRDAALYGRGLGGKFFYCASWKAVLDRIKQSILSGEADRLMQRFGLDTDHVKARVRRMSRHPDAQGRYC